MLSVTVVVVGLCQLVQAGSFARTGHTVHESLSFPRRFGSLQKNTFPAHIRGLCEYDHPAEREGVDLRSFNNVDFRYALAKKQADAAASMKDITREMEVVSNTNNANDLVDTFPVEESHSISSSAPISDTGGLTLTPVEDVESPSAAVPISYQVRIGEDGELDGGEDFGDHSDYDSADGDEDYADDSEQEEWAAPTQTYDDSGATLVVQEDIP
eukprot:jgi/Ulvmu1/7353/UM036_0013.1